DRLEHRTGLRAELIGERAQGFLEMGLVERLGRRQHVPGAPQDVAGAVLRHHLVPRGLVVLERAEGESDQLRYLGQGLHLVLDRRTGRLETWIVVARQSFAAEIVAGSRGE